MINHDEVVQEYTDVELAATRRAAILIMKRLIPVYRKATTHKVKLKIAADLQWQYDHFYACQREQDRRYQEPENVHFVNSEAI